MHDGLEQEASSLLGGSAGEPQGCAAPSNALYFRPDGWVTACCATWHLLGRVTGTERQSLRDIWDAAPARRQREALAADDFGLGCWECAAEIEGGRRAQSMAGSFDRFSSSTGYPRYLDFALSNRCNLQCQMCNGGLSSAIRRHRERRPPMPSAYDDRFFEELDEFLPHVEEARFKGGEPFLSREVRRVWDRLIEIGGSRRLGVTTNGTILNANVEHYVRSLGLDIQVSIDAMDPAVLESIRVGVDADALWRNVDRFQELASEAGSEVGLTFCLMAQTWQELGPVLSEADRRGIGCDVIWVDGPKDFNVLRQPAEVLAEVAAHLDQERSVRPLGAGSARLLDDAFARVAAAAAAAPAPDRGVAVRLERPGARAVEVEALRRRHLADEVEPLVIEYRDEVAVAVTVPSWAAWLDPTDWVGTGLEQVVTLLATSVGGMMRSEVESLDAGVHRITFTIERDEGDDRLIGLYVPPSAGSSSSQLFLAPGERSAAAPGSSSPV